MAATIPFNDITCRFIRTPDEQICVWSEL